MKKIVITSLIICAAIVVVTFGINGVLAKFAPEAEKKESVESIPVVKVISVQKETVDLLLSSEGLIVPRRETVLTAEVTGRIVFVDPRFEVGGSFKTGEVILQLDEVNYQTAVAQAKSTLADAKLTLKQEVARGEQAKRDWGKIGNGKKPSELVLRIPFLESAQARVTSAEAALAKAQEDLDRTRIRAPFDCRVREASLDLGATVMTGTRLGQVYGVSDFEVRLPFSLSDFVLLDQKSDITLKAVLGDRDSQWKAKIIRREGDVDRATLSAYVIAEVLPNKENQQFKLPLPGMFVKAEIKGAQLSQVMPIPRSAVRGRDRVVVVDLEDKLAFRTLKIVRSSEANVYASDGVLDGDRIILTKLELPVAGMKLSVSKEEAPLDDGKDD